MNYSKTLTEALNTLLYIFATIGFIAVLFYIFWLHPILDRTLYRPCHYYPEAFADCREPVK